MPRDGPSAQFLCVLTHRTNSVDPEAKSNEAPERVDEHIPFADDLPLEKTLTETILSDKIRILRPKAALARRARRIAKRIALLSSALMCSCRAHLRLVASFQGRARSSSGTSGMAPPGPQGAAPSRSPVAGAATRTSISSSMAAARAFSAATVTDARSCSENRHRSLQRPVDATISTGARALTTPRPQWDASTMATSSCHGIRRSTQMSGAKPSHMDSSRRTLSHRTVSAS